ncbi:hypothetical protein NXW84_00085 [Bacteroides fragilis]|nr:hypothetical protein NXW84_00085 [Bacteroides fragilis]
MNLLDLIMDAIYQAKVIDYALAAIRLEAILECKIKEFNEKEFSDEKKIIEDLNDLKWYNDNNLKLKDIQEYLSKKIEFNLLSL